MFAMPATIRIGIVGDEIPDEVIHEALGYLVDTNGSVEEVQDDLLALQADPDTTPEALLGAERALAQSIDDLMTAKEDLAELGITMLYDA